MKETNNAPIQKMLKEQIEHGKDHTSTWSFSGDFVDRSA